MMPLKFIGLSGPSSCGKTTLAYLLKHIMPNVAFVLHADDFCKEFKDIPTVNGYLDCDGPDGVDFKRMSEVLDYMKLHDATPPFDFKSWQEEVFPGRQERALATVPAEVIEKLKTKVQNCGDTRLVIVDGFLLYHHPANRKRLDIKLFFRLSHKVTKERRFSRQRLWG
jgi:nicotinamide/nicotinate riboside kinase